METEPVAPGTVAIIFSILMLITVIPAVYYLVLLSVPPLTTKPPLSIAIRSSIANGIFFFCGVMCIYTGLIRANSFLTINYRFGAIGLIIGALIPWPIYLAVYLLRKYLE